MKYKYIYGPVSSFRLGSSLGIDLLSQEEKVCSFDCVYCQLGKTVSYTNQRGLYIPKEAIIEELKTLPQIQIDYITFSGRGEPTLAKNLGETIKAVKAIRKEPVAVLTNSSLMDKGDVREELSWADFVIAKLDACTQEVLETINRPASGVRWDNIYRGIKEFRREYKGRFAIQIMFTYHNKDDAEKLAELSLRISPNEVQIDTPLRPCKVNPLPRKELSVIRGFFKGLSVISVYEVENKIVKSLSDEDTMRRRGKV